MVRVGFGEALPLEDDVFDCVLSQLVIQALDDPPLAAREMARVLAPGGVMATCVWDFRDGMPLLGAYWAAARAVDPEGARRAGGDVTNRWCTPEGLRRLWGGAGASDIEAGELSASAEYEGCDDAWWPFAAGVSASGADCRSLDEQRRSALREEFCRRLGPHDGPLRLSARAWSIRGRTGARGEPALIRAASSVSRGRGKTSKRGCHRAEPVPGREDGFGEGRSRSSRSAPSGFPASTSRRRRAASWRTQP